MLKKVQFVTDADMLQNELSPQQRKITEKYIYRTKCKKKKNLHSPYKVLPVCNFLLFCLILFSHHHTGITFPRRCDQMQKKSWRDLMREH